MERHGPGVRGLDGRMSAGVALVVDDSRVNRLVLVRQLETLGLEVMEVENGL